MIVPRSTSPHPSLSSSGSEEVRCSLDELDAVIATFDEEARQQRQNFICTRSVTSTFCSKSMANNHSDQLRTTLFLENQLSSVVIDPIDYMSATLQNPRRSDARQNLGSFRLSAEYTTYDVKSTNEDNEFPPPPPDPFVSENFILPPPPPPTVLELEDDIVHVNDDKSFTSPDICVVPTTMDTIIPFGVSSVGSTAVATTPATTVSAHPATSNVQHTHACTERLGTAVACKRPVVPQRAPSTRLSSVPVAGLLHNGVDDARPRSLAADPSNPPDRERKRSAECLRNSVVKSSSADRVSVDAKATTIRPPTTLTTTQNTEVAIDHTVPPVCDIIRKFDRNGAITGALCRSVMSQIQPVNGVPYDETKTNSVSTTHNQPTAVRKFSSPGDSPEVTSLSRPSPSGHDNDCLDFSPSPTVQELARGFSFTGRTTTEVGSTGTVPRQCQLSSRQVQQFPPSPVGRVPATTVPNLGAQLHIQKRSSTSGKALGSPQLQLTVDAHSNGLSGQTSLSSFGSAQHAQVNGGSRPSPPLPSPPTLPPIQPVTHVGRSNSIVSGQIDSPDSPIPFSSHSDSVSVHAMRLSAETLETLLQYNIVEAHQIPGYQPVPSGLPDWKLHKLERKNRDAADAYAIDLRKWGCIPQWKRDLIEKRQHGKLDTSVTKTYPTTNDTQPESQSLISAELTEKLQRRLQKVAATAEP